MKKSRHYQGEIYDATLTHTTGRYSYRRMLGEQIYEWHFDPSIPSNAHLYVGYEIGTIHLSSMSAFHFKGT